MYSVDPLELCTDIFKLYHIRFQLFAPPYRNADNFDFGLRRLLFPTYDYTPLMQQISDLLHPGEILYLQDEFGISYNIFSLQDGPVKTSYQFGVLGPWRRGAFDDYTIQHILEQNELPQNCASLLRSIIGRIPENMPREQWITLCTRIVGKLISPDGNVKFYIPDTKQLCLDIKPSPAEDFGKEDFLMYQGRSLSFAYSLETSLIDAVKKGNYAQAKDFAYKYTHFQQQYRKELQMPESFFYIELNALLRHAAQEAGVFALRLDEVYAKYCRLLMQDKSDISQSLMIRDYCNMVLQYSNLKVSPIIRNCIDYIDYFFSQPISLRDLADRNSVTEQYLSALFRKELQITFVEYLTQARINHAKRLLMSYELSIQEIAMLCGYNDSSYFCKVFKKYIKMSPMQYRDSIHLEN